MKRALVVAALCAIGLAGCQSGSSSQGGQGGGLSGVVWQELANSPQHKVVMTLQFHQDGEYGAVVLPYYGTSGTYVEVGSHLTLVMVVSSLTISGPDSPQERLTQTSTFSISNGQLTLYDASGVALFVFVSGGPPTPCYDCLYTPRP